MSNVIDIDKTNVALLKRNMELCFKIIELKRANKKLRKQLRKLKNDRD